MLIWTTGLDNVHLNFSPCKLQCMMKLHICRDSTKLIK
uniref:Uncharacterized protein n=1 Tax=Arundo donax TaxID=35708 RepID=A0A0A9HSJ5_ARUDO